MDAEAERDDARADREHADDATAQAITRMGALKHELAELRGATEAEYSALASATVTPAEHAQAAEVDETARIRAYHKRALGQFITAASARIPLLTRDRPTCMDLPYRFTG